MTSSIQSLWTEMPLNRTRTTEEVPAAPKQLQTPFSDIFRTAIDAVKETDAERVQTEYLLSTGQLDNPALATIASTKAQLSVDLLVQLRSKSLEAYNELMRISI